MSQKVILAVAKGTPIPHTVMLKADFTKKIRTQHIFNPTCEVDEVVARRQISAYPEKFFIVSAGEKINPADYPVNKISIRQEIDSVLSKLNPEQALQVITFAESIAQGEEMAEALTNTASAKISQLEESLASAQDEVDRLSVLVSNNGGDTYDKWTSEALKEEAKEKGIEIPAGAKKEEIVELLRNQ